MEVEKYSFGREKYFFEVETYSFVLRIPTQSSGQSTVTPTDNGVANISLVALSLDRHKFDWIPIDLNCQQKSMIVCKKISG